MGRHTFRRDLLLIALTAFNCAMWLVYIPAQILRML